MEPMENTMTGPRLVLILLWALALDLAIFDACAIVVKAAL